MAMSDPPKLYWPLADNMNINTASNITYAPNISVGADSVFDFIPNDYINLGTTLQDVLNSNQNTISLWFRSDTASNFDTVFSQGKDQSTGYRFFVSSSDLSLNRAETGSNTRHEVDVAFEHQRWNHLVVVTNTSNTSILSAYLNGDFVGGSSSGSISYSNGGNEAWIGGQSGISQYWDGQISNVQIWNTDLTGPEVTTLYNNGQPLMTGTQPQTANLKAWYKLNQSSNWEADSVGNWQIPDATSAFPQSFKFIQANSDSIDVGSVNLGTENSISFWYNFNDSGSTQTVIGGSGTQSYVVQFGGNFIAIRPDGGNDVFYSPYFNQISPPYKTQGVWGHYLITRNGNTIRLFINGNEETVSGTGTGMGDTVVTRIGSNDGGGFYANAEISNVAFWNTDRSSEKDSIYNNGTPATSYTTTPQYWYKLDNTSVWNPDPANYWTFPNAGEQDNSGIFNFSN